MNDDLGPLIEASSKYPKQYPMPHTKLNRSQQCNIKPYKASKFREEFQDYLENIARIPDWSTPNTKYEDVTS